MKIRYRWADIATCVLVSAATVWLALTFVAAL